MMASNIWFEPLENDIMETKDRGAARLFFVPEMGEGYKKTYIFKITSSYPYLNFYLTWMSNYSDWPDGLQYDQDDLDLYVTTETLFGQLRKFRTTSLYNTTERLWHFAGTKKEYKVEIVIKTKNSNTDGIIYAALAWCPSN